MGAGVTIYMRGSGVGAPFRLRSRSFCFRNSFVFNELRHRRPKIFNFVLQSLRFNANKTTLIPPFIQQFPPLIPAIESYTITIHLSIYLISLSFHLYDYSIVWGY